MATDQTATAVPGIPLAALDAIADQNVRDVLRAIVDGWHVRNGNAGSGDNRFVTASEVGLKSGQSKLSSAAPAAQVQPSSQIISPSQISRIINDLQAQIIESPLFKELGERVDLIDQPGGIFARLATVEIVVTSEIEERQTADTAEIDARTELGVRVGAAEGAITTETSLRANADNAIVQTITVQYAAVNQSLSLVQQSVSTVSNTVSSQAQQISQVQASVGSNSTAIQQESTARVTADGQINAKYSIKIDVNGYVSGYGLISAANNATPTSEFIVRADKFAIGSPSGPGITPQVPFIVLTTATTVGGQTVAPGVYIDNAIIKNGSINAVKIGDAEITNAKIGNAAVGTLKIAGESVVVPRTAGRSDSVGSGEILSCSVTLDYAGTLLAIASIGQSFNGGNTSWGLSLLIDGVQVAVAGGGAPSDSVALSGSLYVAAGAHTVTVSRSTGGSSVALSRNVTVFGAKR